MASRDAFLARVRQAAEMGRAYRVHLKPFPETTGYLGVEGDLCERFVAEVNAVGGQAILVADLDAARRQLHELLAEARARSAVVWRHELLDRLGLAELLTTPGIDVFDHDRLAALPPAERRARLLACDIGITSCQCAIAETGTLMMCSRPGRERVASLLPPYHVAIVERRQIVPDLMDAFVILGDRGQESGVGSRESVNLHSALRTPQSPIPSNITLITGPSKTGDIELQLTTGVHGPGKWRVIVVG